MNDGIAIKKDITEMAKETMKFAMQGFTTPEYKKMHYLRTRRWHWIDNGFSESDAIKKAEEDYEWAHN